MNKNIRMNNTFFRNNFSQEKKETSPRRAEKRSLPTICHKEVPLHNNSVEKGYKETISHGLEMQNWAYVVNPKKKDYITTKYAKFFNEFKNTSPGGYNPEQEGKSASLALLQKYFKRKQASKLREIIKVPMQSAQEGVSSIGFEGINFQNSKNRKTVQGFYKAKKNQIQSKIESNTIAVQARTTHRIGKKHLSTYDEKQLSTVDFYFSEKDHPPIEEKKCQ